MNHPVQQMEHRRVLNPVLHIALYQPEIPANTGNIARLCGAAELRLHLIHPLGFRVDDRHLKRAGLDYWPEVDVVHHSSFDDYLAALEHREPRAPVIAFSRHADRLYTEALIGEGAHLLFGPETRGLPEHIRSSFSCYAIPIWGRVRSLNLSTSVGIVAYHYLYTLGRFGGG